MSNYYEEVQRANRYIDEKITTVCYSQGEELDLNHLTLDITSKFPVGEKIVKKRISLFLKVKKDLRLLDDKLFSSGEVA